MTNLNNYIGKIYTYGGTTSLAVYATPEMFNTKKVGTVNPSENIVVLAIIRDFAYYWIQILTANGIVGWFVWGQNRYIIEEISSQYV